MNQRKPNRFFLILLGFQRHKSVDWDQHELNNRLDVEKELLYSLTRIDKPQQKEETFFLF